MTYPDEAPIEKILQSIRSEIKSSLTDPNLTHAELRLVQRYMLFLETLFTELRMQLSGVMDKLIEVETQLTASDKYALESRPEGHAVATTWELQNILLRDILDSMKNILKPQM